MKYYFVIFLCLILVSCNKNTEKNELSVENVNDIVENENVEYPLEETASNLGTYCTTNVIENNVNVMNFPSLEAEILFQINKDDIVRIVGVSGEKVNIDNFYGDWICIVLSNGNKGWVFSKYLNIGEIEYSPISFVEHIPATNRNSGGIKISYILQDKEIITTVDYTNWNDYYIIVWDLLQYRYHYTNRPGVYIINKETNELKHITYLGCFEFWPHAYTLFTDDFEYLIQDSGSGPGVRGITAWRLKDLQEVYSGSYYGMNISHHTIAVAYAYDEHSFRLGYTDEEIMAYGKKYKEENPLLPDEVEKTRQETGLGVELIINCSYNLDTGEREILGVTYVFTQ
jgi:hypothetical protein